jgi:hypothetical protein
LLVIDASKDVDVLEDSGWIWCARHIDLGYTAISSDIRVCRN